MNTNLIIIFFILALVVVSNAIWKKYVKTIVVPMHHRCIYSRYGKLCRVLESGRYRFLGAGHEFKQVDTRLLQITLQTQELTTLEGITVKATAVGLYRIIDPLLATSATEDFSSILYTLIQLALRDIVSGIEAESLLANVRNLSPKLLERVQAKASNLGLEITELVIRDVIFPADIKASLSESWRTKKAVLAELEAARGKAAVARTMANASKLYETNPVMLKIRYIEALEHASKGMGNTFVIGMPEDKAINHI
jgi:regulator of protease activity HflC (stomatin/prohibitin superfamily)